MIHHGTVSQAEKIEKIREKARMPLAPTPFGMLIDTDGTLLGRDELNDLQLLLTDRGTSEEESEISPAGFTFFGQFIDHDMTLAVLRSGVDDLRAFTPVEAFLNLRTPNLELDSVFGLGPKQPTSSALYRPDLSLKTGVDTGGFPWDLPRELDQTAIIGDPRNDENKILAQLHTSFIWAYNRMLEKEPATDPLERHKRARERLYTTYQYILLFDYLARFTEPEIFKVVLKKGAKRFEEMVKRAGGTVVIPVEFAVAAFRFGHSQVRSGYRMNLGPNSGARLFSDDGRDLNGGAVIDTFLRFDPTLFFSDTRPLPSEVNRARRIDARLALPLFSLEAPAIPSSENGHPHPIGTPANPRSLGHRNLLRARQVQLIDGFQAAKALEVPALTVEELELTRFNALQNTPPLWYYILQEALVKGKGERLGPVGSFILCETFIGILENTKTSFFNIHSKDWTPPDGLTTMAKLMDFADVPSTPH